MLTRLVSKSCRRLKLFQSETVNVDEVEKEKEGGRKRVEVV